MPKQINLLTSVLFLILELEILWQNSRKMYKTESVQRDYFRDFFHRCVHMHKENQVFIEEDFICINQQIQILIFIWQCEVHF